MQHATLVTRESRAVEGALIGLAATVTRGGEVGYALGDHGIDRLGNDAILKHGLREVVNIVHDDVRAVLRQTQYPLREGRFAIKGGRVG